MAVRVGVREGGVEGGEGRRHGRRSGGEGEGWWGPLGAVPSGALSKEEAICSLRGWFYQILTRDH